MRFLGRLVAFAVNNPKEMDAKLFKDEPVGQLGDNGENVPVDPEQYERWW